MEGTQSQLAMQHGSQNIKKSAVNSVGCSLNKEAPKANHNGFDGLETKVNSTTVNMTDNLQDRLLPSTDSDSHGSSSPAFAEPPSFEDVADDLSEAQLSELEYNFDGPIDWPDGDPLADESCLDLSSKILRRNTPFLEKSAKLLLYHKENPELKTVDPQTQARLEALLEAAGINKLSTTDGKAFADPEVLRKLTSSVSCALDEAAAALTRMRTETQSSNSQEDRSLEKACSDGDIEAVKRLLSEGRSVHETTEDGESLLSLACSAGYYELAEILLRMRANVEDRGIKGDCTPLMEAASGGFVDIVRLLLQYSADVNAQSTAGHTALHHAAVGGYEDVVQVLIDAGANVEEQNENGHTPLMEAASAGHVRVAQLLLAHGAGINTHSNEFKESALTLACYKGHLDMVKFLLDAGADQEHKTDEMHTALMEASMDGHVEVAKLLLDSGAQVNMPADSFESPLTLAACGGHVELANLLIERGANLEEVNDEGYTPLMEAAREGHEEMVALLLAHGADVNGQTEETQETALTLACCGGFLEVAHFLIKANADIELGCSTPLMEAAQEGHLDLVKYLIKQGANVHATTGTGDTALTYACENGHTDVADILLQAGANLEHESEGGRTPLMKAARAGHQCTVQFLLSKGADVNRATSNNDHTVLSLACAGGHQNVVELLLENGANPQYKLRDGSTMLIEAARCGHTTVVNLLLDYPYSSPKSNKIAEEHPDRIPMADEGACDSADSKDLGLKSAETLASRLEQFIHKMMSQAENSSGTREEQMARKQEILEELQRVEQELKYRTQLASTDGPSDALHHLDMPDDFPIHPPPTSLSSSPPVFTPSHELVKLELQQKQMVMKEQQQQSETYQARLQFLKQQYQQKHLQLQQQRQKLLSEPVNYGYTEPPGEPIRRQPVPLHIALQSHLQNHHVTEGNVNDLAQALQDWDTRDRNINFPPTHVKPMPAFNLSIKHEDELDSSCADEVPFATEVPRSRPLADSLAPIIHGKGKDISKSADPLADSLAQIIQKESVKPYDPFAESLAAVIQSQGKDINRNIDPCLENGSENYLNTKKNPSEHELTMKTLKWLQKVDASCETPAPVEQSKLKISSQSQMMTVPKPVAKDINERSATKITKVPNGCLDGGRGTLDTLRSGKPSLALPNLQRSNSPVRTPIVDPNAATDSNNDTALTLACAGGHADLVRLLISRQCEIEHRDKKGFTPLILAATAGHAEVVEILIENGADIEAQSERTKDTPLSLACSGGRYEVVEMLLRLGANKEHRNVSDYTPLSLAASGGYVNIIKLLLSYGAEINSRTGSKLGISPLMLAAMNGHTAAVKLLLDMGSDINAQIETNRNTALTLACFQGRHEVVSLLVDRKANIEHRAKTGLTPLMEAASGGYVEVGKVLLDKNADVNAPPVPSSKDTALTIAADKGHYRFVELLLARGAAVDVKNKKGNSPLWLACNGGHLDVVQLLVSNKADIDTQDNRRVSALMTAFRKGHVKVVKWLVRHVTQFPSDKECARYITTVNDKELLRKCQSCMEIIVQAKDAQAKEAQKNAEFLLEEIESEKSREEKRKEAAARKREKKKQKRKEKQAESQPSDSGASDRKRSLTPPGSNDAESEPDDQDDLDDLSEPVHLPPQILPEEPQYSPQPSRKSQPKSKSSERTEKIDTKDDVSSDKENLKKNRTNKKDKAVTSSKNGRAEVKDSEKTMAIEVKIQKNITSTTRIAELDDFGDVALITNGKPSKISNNKRERNISNISGLDTFEPLMSNKYISPSKPTQIKSMVSPSPGKKKRADDEWKEVVRKSRKLVVPATAVSRFKKQVINAIKDKSGASIEFEKPSKKLDEQTLVIRGSAEATRAASDMVNLLLRDKDRDFENVWSKKALVQTPPQGLATLPPQIGPLDPQANMGSFVIGDFIVSSQTTVITETKPKPVQTKPGWPAKPPNQSVWRLPNVPPVPSTNVQPSVSPRENSITQNISLFNQVPCSTVLPKQISDVSRQLFPDSQPLVVNSQPVTPISKPKQQIVRSPGDYPSQNSPPLSSLLNSPLIQPIQPPLSQQNVSRSRPPINTIGMRPPVSFSPFDDPIVTPKLPASLYEPSQIDLPASHMKMPVYRPVPMTNAFPPAEEGIPLVPVNKAPGYRPDHQKNQVSSPRPAPAISTSSIFMDSQMALGDRDQYTTPFSPMTLPRISSLNPNATEFTSGKFVIPDNNSQQSPQPANIRTPQTSPSVDIQSNPPAFLPPPARQSNNQQQFIEQEFPVRSFYSSAMPMNMTSFPANSMMQSSSYMPYSTYSPPAHPLVIAMPADVIRSPKYGDTFISAQEAESLKKMGPIGLDRPRRTPLYNDPVNPTNLWAAGDWLMSQNQMPDLPQPSMIFKPEIQTLMTNVSAPPYPYYGGMAGGTGDSLQNAWNVSPSKMNSLQDWSWNQPNPSN